MSFPGMARHIIVLRCTFLINLGNRYPIAKQNRVPDFRGGYKVEQNILHRSANTDFPDPHFAFERYRDNFAVEQVHRTSTPLGRCYRQTESSGGDDLAKRNPAVIWRHALMPIRFKAGVQ